MNRLAPARPRFPIPRSSACALAAAFLLALAALGIGCATGSKPAPGADAPSEDHVTLHLRSISPEGEEATRAVEWDPKRTALVICDMWDDHWCRSASARVAELAGPLNETIEAARARGMFVVHAPSSVVSFYDGTPQRERARNAPFAEPPVPLSQDERWGTKWCWPDSPREPEMPVDDSDMGCDCAVKCEIRDAWKRQIETIRIAPEDAITDDGQEAYNLLAERGIDHVILAGVHLNMCVLGRPFAIRQMVKLGKDVALMRDMTDTMYDPRRRPFVSHFEGTDLVVRHVERYWCPSFESSDITGRPPFRFAADPRPRD